MSLKKGILIGLIVVIVGLPIAISSAFFIAFKGRVYPNTWIANVSLGGISKDQALNLLNTKLKNANKLSFAVDGNNQSWETTQEEIDLNFSLEKTIDAAYKFSRETPIRSWFRKKSLTLEFSLNQEALDKKIATIAAEIYKPNIPTEISFNKESKEISATQGEVGVQLDTDLSKEVILEKIAWLEIDQPIVLPLEASEDLPSPEEIEAGVEKAKKLIDKSLTLTSDGQSFLIEDEQLINFVSFSRDWNEEKIDEYCQILAQSVDQKAEDALFKFEEGKVTAFQPDKVGLKLDQTKTREKIVEGLDEIINTGSSNIQTLVLEKTEPNIKTSDTNRLGITELLGEGSSYFAHSIASRVHNVDWASSHLDGILIAPGETFSVNDTLGDISQATGYKSAYIIKDGRTVLGDGGGVCQISTTIFRAALEAGLPIVERRAHAYRVGYYEQDAKPGLDATVFSPTTDFKFKNDTQNNILIQRKIDLTNYHLVFQLYGTSDGRKAEIGNFRLWDVTPPPADLYVDDPTLPIGTVKQIDWKSWGGKAAFDWKVVRGEEILEEKTFYSAYKPWQAIYLKGTKVN